LPGQDKVKTEKKSGARIESEGLKSNKSILIKIGVLRDGGIARGFENGRSPRYPSAKNAEQGGKSAKVTMKGWKRWVDSRIISSGFCAELLGKFLESGINFGNFDALEARLQKIVMILIRGRQDTPGVPDDADMISFRQPEFSGRPAKGDQG
jgi:hypothetical protein